MLALAREYSVLHHLRDKPAHHWPRAADHLGPIIVPQFECQQRTARILDSEARRHFGEHRLQPLAIGERHQRSVAMHDGAPEGVEALEQGDQRSVIGIGEQLNDTLAANQRYRAVG